MKTLIILAHPDIKSSRINKAWKEELEKYPENIVVHDLYENYPDWNIDVAKEQALLESFDNVVLQFPLYWYSAPALLKQWQDFVFTYGWAFGSTGDKLANKNFGFAVSVGSGEENYQKSENGGYTIDEILVPFTAGLNFTRAITHKPHLLYGCAFDVSDEQIAQNAKEYVDYLFKTFK